VRRVTLRLVIMLMRVLLRMGPVYTCIWQQSRIIAGHVVAVALNPLGTRVWW
jgi:hypothetical protein